MRPEGRWVVLELRDHTSWFAQGVRSIEPYSKPMTCSTGIFLQGTSIQELGVAVEVTGKEFLAHIASCYPCGLSSTNQGPRLYSLCVS